MLKTSVFALAAAFAAGAAAEQTARPHPADPTVAVKEPAYESALRDYRPWTEPELARWREVNEEVRRLGGHSGHIRGSVQAPKDSPGAEQPAAQPGKGDRK